MFSNHKCSLTFNFSSTVRHVALWSSFFFFLFLVINNLMFVYFRFSNIIIILAINYNLFCPCLLSTNIETWAPFTSLTLSDQKTVDWLYVSSLMPRCFCHCRLFLHLRKTKREQSGSWGAITAPLSHEWLLDMGLCGVSGRAPYLRHATF